jgi:antitoxin PrlF
MHVYRISSKGQVTLPKEVRKCLQLEEGDYIIFGKENGKIFIDKAQISSSPIENEK